MTSAEGAGGSKRSASYFGIGDNLKNLFFEICCLFGMNKSGARYLPYSLVSEVRNDYKNPCLLRKRDLRRQSDLTMVDDPFKCRDFHLSPRC